MLAAMSCTGSDSDDKLWSEPSASDEASKGSAEVSVAGIWRASLLSPGGELPFSISIYDKGGQLSGALFAVGVLLVLDRLAEPGLVVDELDQVDPD